MVKVHTNQIRKWKAQFLEITDLAFECSNDDRHEFEELGKEKRFARAKIVFLCFSLDFMSRILLICSNGGHLLQLKQLEDIYANHDCAWVCFKKEDAISLLKGQTVFWAFYPTNRNLKNFVRNLFQAIIVMLKIKPTHILSTGAGVAIPYFFLARMFGIKSCFIESFARIYKPSLSGRICYILATRFLFQWESLEQFYPKGKYVGSIYQI